jgi:sulfur relay (sulfurtransferase) complex TusBCD TusD component (DsrE family)
VLQSRGARVRSCITCLEFYGLADNLAIGESGTMADLAQAMVAADKIVRP